MKTAIFNPTNPRFKGTMLKQIGIFALFAIVLLTACKTTQPVVVTEYRDRVYHDTIQQVDTIWQDRFHLEYMQGDTLVLRDSVYLYKYAYKDKVVETYIHDSIPYPVEVPVQVRQRNGYDRFTSWGFWILLALLLLAIAWRIAKDYIKAKINAIGNII